jgi:hypothetical protein
MPLTHASDRPRPGPLQGQHRSQRVQRRLAVGRIYERRDLRAPGLLARHSLGVVR